MPISLSEILASFGSNNNALNSLHEDEQVLSSVYPSSVSNNHSCQGNMGDLYNHSSNYLNNGNTTTSNNINNNNNNNNNLLGNYHPNNNGLEMNNNNNNLGLSSDPQELMWARTVLLNHQRELAMSMPSQTLAGRKFDPFDDNMSVHSSASSKKKPVESFPEKLHRMLEDAEMEGNSHIVGFFAQGRAFAVHDSDTFVRAIMPRYFTTSRFSSFQRQLNLYGFRRIVERNMSGFCHEHFLQGQKEMAILITRKKQRVPGGADDDAITARRLEERMNAKGDEYSVISFGSASHGSSSTSASSQRMSMADARQQMADMRSLLASTQQHAASMPPPVPRQPDIPQQNFSTAAMGFGHMEPTNIPTSTNAQNHLQDMRSLLQLQAQMQSGTLK